MNSKERVRAAMDLQSVDKLPLMCQFSIGHMLLQLKVSPSRFWFDPKTYADGLIQLREIYDFDGILISLYGHDPQWEKNVKDIIVTNEYELILWKNGTKTFCPYNDLPFYQLDDKIKKDIADISINDLPKSLNYIPVSQNLHFHFDSTHKLDVINDLVIRAGHNYSIHGEITSPFDYLIDFLGLDNCMIAFIDNPDKCLMILKHFTALIKELAIDMCQTGIDAIKLSSPFAGAGFISPEFYKIFVLPFEKEIAVAVRNKNIHIYTHTCGAINDRLELMFEAGISGIECLDPPPLGNVELEEAFERIDKKGFIKGNIDSVNTLLSSNQEEILQVLKNKIEIGRSKKGFILSTACSIAPQVEREKISLLRKAIEMFC